MRVGRRVVLSIYCMGLITVFLSGCQMKKQANVGSEVSGDGENQSGEILKVENSKGDLEKLVQNFIGITLDEAVQNGAEYEEENGEESLTYEKGTTFFSYTGKSMEGLGPMVTYKDQYEMAAEQYETAISDLRHPHLNSIIEWGLREALPEENLDNCTKEEALERCNPYAELLGYDSENSEAEVYALTLDKLENTELSTYGPLKGKNNTNTLTADQLRDIEKDYPWSKEYEAMYVVYKPYINGILLDSNYCQIEMVYVPKYERVVYVMAEIPWIVTKKSAVGSLISKEDAVAQAMLVNHITNEKNFKADSVTLVYSQNIVHLQEDSELDLCWRVNFKIENSAQYSGAEAYKTTLINAVTGEECGMWPGLND